MAQNTVPPLICLTAAGILIQDKKVLLVKHRKLGIWLAPGGHWEANELPHQTAQREFFEETGLKVKATPHQWARPEDKSDSWYVPNPILSNVHWISKKNYQARVAGQSQIDIQWQRGCEQHLSLIYLMRPVGVLDLQPNAKEVTDIGWFGQDDLKNLSTTDDIKREIAFALKN